MSSGEEVVCLLNATIDEARGIHGPRWSYNVTTHDKGRALRCIVPRELLVFR